MSWGSHSKIETITGVQPRRRWTPERKLAWVMRTTERGMSVSVVAREAGISTSQLFQWRKAYLEGSLVAVATNEPTVARFGVVGCPEVHQTTGSSTGAKILENGILKRTVVFARAKKWSARSPAFPGVRAVRAVCSVLGVECSHLMERLNRPEDLQDRREEPPRPDYGELLEAINDVAQDRASYGYRRVWAVLLLEGQRANHKRICRVMRDQQPLLHRRGDKPIPSRRHDGQIAVDTRNIR